MVVAAVRTYLLAVLFLLGGMLAATPGALSSAAAVSAQAAEPSPGAQPAADWQRGLPGVRPFALAVHPTDPTRLYVAGFPGPGDLANVYASQDGGDTWTIVTDPPVYTIIAGQWIPISSFVTLAVGLDGTLYLADRERGIRKSPDCGATWQAVYETGGIGGFAVDPADPARVYAVQGGAEVLYLGGGCGLLRTTDFGATWTQLDVPSTVLRLATNPGRPGQLFAVVTSSAITESGLWLSDDFGESWTVRSAPPYIYQFALDPRDRTGASFAIAAESWGVEAPGGIYRTTDGGASSRPLGLPPTRPGGRPRAVVRQTMLIVGGWLFAGTNSGLWATSLPPAP